VKKETQRAIALTLVIFIVGTIALSLAGCSSDPLAEQFRSGDSKNYIAGDGTVTEFDSEQRPTFLPFTVEGLMLTPSFLAAVKLALDILYDILLFFHYNLS
jgi:hypothetical protein